MRYLSHIQAAAMELISRLDEATRRQFGDFTILFSHEARTPVTSIQGFSGYLSDGEAGPLSEAQLAALQHIQHQAEELMTLANVLVDILKTSVSELPTDTTIPESNAPNMENNRMGNN